MKKMILILMKMMNIAVEGIQAESRSQDIPTSEQSGLTVYTRWKMNQRDHPVQYFHIHYPFNLFLKIKQNDK